MQIFRKHCTGVYTLYTLYALYKTLNKLLKANILNSRIIVQFFNIF